MRLLILAAISGAILSAIGFASWLMWRKRRGEAMAEAWDQAIGLFRLRREWLEARYLSLASQSGKPRGLEWIDCQFRDEVTFARDRHDGRLRALIGVIIRFRPEPGSLFADSDEGNDDRVRLATCVFWYEQGEWLTDGRALFNLTPQEAVEFLRNELEVVDR